MKWVAFAVLTFVVASTGASVRAQDRDRLRFEMSRGDTVIARPDLVLTPGAQGGVVLNGETLADSRLRGLQERMDVTFTPRGDDIALAFTIVSGDRRFHPTVVISKTVPGSLQWTAADGDPLTVTVSWVP
jgi:hypothetical protein